VEHTPAPPRPAAPPAPSAPTPPPGPPATPVAAHIDQKVLEAVIGAVEARLHEHAGQVDRRFADLEARFAVSHQQDRQTAAARVEIEQELRALRENLTRSVAAQSGLYTEQQMLRQQNERIVDAVDQRFEDMRQEYNQQIADLRQNVSQAFDAQAAAQEQRFGTLQQSMETRIVNAATAAAVDRIDDQLAPLRAEIRQREQELVELRQRLAESESSVLEVILAMGVVCRQAAERVGVSREQSPPVPTPAPVIMAPVAEEFAPAIAAQELEPEPKPEPVSTVDPMPIQSVPEFLNGNGRKTASWRIPLVSSFLVSTGYLVLMHYLSAPLQ
jgi:hypothetical protein